MPGLDGLELIQKVRDAGAAPLFILISGYRHFEYARTAVSLGVMDYLLKPVDEAQLNETLERVTGTGHIVLEGASLDIGPDAAFAGTVSGDGAVVYKKR